MSAETVLPSCAFLLDAAAKDEELSPQIVHLHPKNAALSKRARALSPLLVAIWGVARRVAGNEVRHALPSTSAATSIS